MNVLIYGGGAVGLGLASCLIRPGHRVEILARAETVAALRARACSEQAFSDVSMSSQMRFAAAVR